MNTKPATPRKEMSFALQWLRVMACICALNGLMFLALWFQHNSIQ